MKYLLDTNAVIALVNRQSVSLRARVLEQAPVDIGISVIVYHELYCGAFKSQRLAANLDVVDRLEFESVEFTKKDAREAGQGRDLVPWRTDRGSLSRARKRWRRKMPESGVDAQPGTASRVTRTRASSFASAAPESIDCAAFHAPSR